MTRSLEAGVDRLGVGAFASTTAGALVRDAIRPAALPNLDDRCGRLMLATSFNAWYEDSQIEATAGTEGVTTTDNSASKREFTEGDRYSDYGPLYLDLLREAAAEEAAADQKVPRRGVEPLSAP